MGSQHDAPTHEDEPRLSVTRVWARNFKSIRELDLELGGSYVLVGIKRFRQEQRAGRLDAYGFVAIKTRGV